MKTFFFLLLLNLAVKSNAQSLEGEWNGYFTTHNIFTNQDIKFNFIKKGDSTYFAFSTTILIRNGYPDTVVCLLKGIFSKGKNLFLQETKIVKINTNYDETTYLQSMDLQFIKHKRKFELYGTWATQDGVYGEIYLFKKL
jgi:hypothetical protein